MEETYLYRQIAADIRRKILQGELKPGDRLPSVRTMIVRWNCTIGTIQHAYQELVSQGLITSRPGQGTRVVERLPTQTDTPLRRAALIHRAESFLLEVLTAGYSPAEVEDSVRQALERWRVVTEETAELPGQTLRFVGSHDLAVAWLATHFSDIAPGYTLQLKFTGSLGGLIALAEGKADLAGSHLWDEETDSYNAPFVRRLLPGQGIVLVTLAHRRIGLIVPAGNPAGLRSLADLVQSGLRFVNRQHGSGTRVWLDAQLRKSGINSDQIEGYTNEKLTHSEVAHTVAEGQADAGLGLEAAAHIYGLGFIQLLREKYDLVIPQKLIDHIPVGALLDWLKAQENRESLAHLAGYDTSHMGEILML